MNLLVRADASIAMGTGHVMRCLALAQAWQDSGGKAIFATAQATAALESRIVEEWMAVSRVSAGRPGSDEDARATIGIARERQAEWIVVDGYQFGSEYLGSLKAAGLKVLFIDDYGHAAHYAADLVLNQNSYAQEGTYKLREPYTRLLLGTKYCLLRREFARWRDWRREIAPVGRKILITMGGSDADNVTGAVIDALASLDDIELTVVVGGSNPHLDELRKAVARYGGRFNLQQDVRNMPEFMAWADIAVASAGSTCWEMSLLKLPLVLVDMAENQKPIARSLESLGAGIHLGSAKSVTTGEIGDRVRALLSSPAQRADLSASCGALVDGLGASRVLNELTKH